MIVHQFTFETSSHLAGKATRFYIWRRAGWQIVALTLAVLVLLVMFAEGAREWYLFLLMGYGCAKLLAWISFYRRSLSYVRNMSDASVEVSLTEDGMEMKDSTGGGDVKWTASVNVWKAKDFWLFSYGNTRIYTYMPAAVLTDEVQHFIESRVVQSGGSIT